MSYPQFLHENVIEVSMALFEQWNVERDKFQAGIHPEQIATAVMVWLMMHGRAEEPKRHSVAEIARAFNTTPAVIREGVEAGYWMFLVGSMGDPEALFVELEGE